MRYTLGADNKLNIDLKWLPKRAEIRSIQASSDHDAIHLFSKCSKRFLDWGKFFCRKIRPISTTKDSWRPNWDKLLSRSLTGSTLRHLNQSKFSGQKFDSTGGKNFQKLFAISSQDQMSKFEQSFWQKYDFTRNHREYISTFKLRQNIFANLKPRSNISIGGKFFRHNIFANLKPRSDI